MKQNVVEVKKLKIREVTIPIVGTSPLIIHKFDEKTRHQIEAKQQGKSKSSKHDIRMPEDEFEGAKYKSPQGWEGFPAGGFKKAMIRGAKMVGLVMKDAQMAFFVKADCEEMQLVKIEGESKMRTDMVRIGMGSADVRYRPEYTNWSANLIIEFNEGIISAEQIYQIVDAAGYGCGVGEWRPERGGGGYGRFRIDA